MKQLLQSGIISDSTQRKAIKQKQVGFSGDSGKRDPMSHGLTEEEYIADAYQNGSLKNCIPSGKEYNASVLASNKSKLVGLIMDKVEFHLYTVDSDLMVRVWDCSTNACIRSYLIETRDD